MSRSFWLSLYESWIWLGVPMTVAAVVGLWLLISGVVAQSRRAHLFKVSLAANQVVEFREVGPVVLSIEGPRGSTRWASVDFELRGINGETVEGRTTWFHAVTSGVSTARMELLKYSIPRPGRYVLSMTGLGAERPGDAGHSVVFMRPHLRQSILYVLGIVLSSLVFIASLVFFLMRVVETRRGT